jgi:hypothetical protein
MAGRIAYLGNISTQGLVLDLDAGIMGSYPKTGSTWFDISNNGNNGTLTNGPTFTGSNYGAIVFDGVNDYFITNAATSYVTATSSPITGFAWINIAKHTTCSIWQIGENADNNYSTGLGIDGITLSWMGNGPFSSIAKSPFNITTGSWIHTGMSKNGANITFYQNGSPSKASSGYGSTITPNKITVGVGSRNAGNEGYYSGSIASVQIFNREISQFDVWQNFNSYKSRYGIPDIVTDGLILNLDAGNPYSYLSGSSGTTWTNTVAVSSSISGTLVNGPVYSNGYITCDGVNDYIQVLDNNSLDFGSGSFTVEYWFRKLADTSNFSNIWGVNKWNTGAVPGSNEWTLAIGNGSNPAGGNNFAFAVEAGTTIYGTPNSTTPLSLNTWYQLVGQRDGANLKVYLNGVLNMNVTASGFTTSSAVNNAGRDLRINNSALNLYYTKVDNANLKIYNRALSSDEVQQNFNALRGRYGI